MLIRLFGQGKLIFESKSDPLQNIEEERKFQTENNYQRTVEIKSHVLQSNLLIFSFSNFVLVIMHFE